MVVDESAFSLDLTVEALRGFGIRSVHRCQNGAEAQQQLKLHTVDLLLVDCDMTLMTGHDVVRWLRNSQLEANAFVPVIMTASHVRKSMLAMIRDCGANFVVTRPFSAAVILERIVWVARDERPFLVAGGYAGPDRRFNAERPRPSGERRATMLRRIGQQIDEAVAQAAGGRASKDSTP